MQQTEVGHKKTVNKILTFFKDKDKIFLFSSIVEKSFLLGFKIFQIF